MIEKVILHYRILEELGRGGMGVVYKAEDLKLHRIVALKFLPENLTSSEDETIRFEREAEAISALNHPNIATIFDFDEAEGRKFLSLEYLPGGTLKSKVKEFLSRGEDPPIEDVLGYGIQMADGLAHAHRRQIVHRDVKTDNVMLTEDGRVKITDFGLAKFKGAAHLTRTGSTIGTVAYMSPEQIQGLEVDNRSDLFSLGVVLYELTTCHLPFGGDYEGALAYSIVQKDPLALATYRKGVPETLVHVIQKCLQKDKTARYQSADEVAADLRSIQPGADGTGKTVVARAKRRWIPSVAIVLAAVVLYMIIPSTRPDSPAAKTIAVLPFINMSGNSEDEYFSDGMMEDILTQLGKIASLRVISRTTMMQYKGTRKTMRDIGKDLNAGVVLEGSVRRSADVVQITARLIDSQNDEQLWVETYDNTLKQIFDIQSDVAQKIAKALEAKLSPSEKARIEKKFTDNLEAYDLYLQGRHYWNKRLPDKLKIGIDLFNRAIAQDSNYALAYAGLADSYTILGNFNVFPPQETYPKAKAAALRALAIDSNLAEARASLGFALMNYDWNWHASEREFKGAVELNPNYANGYMWYAFLLTVTGRFEEATTMRKKASELDPLSPAINVDIGLTLYFARRYDEAIEQFKKALGIDPTFVLAYVPLGGAYVQKKMYKEAIAAYQNLTMGLAVAHQRHPIPIAALGHVYAVSGRTEDALNMLELVQEMSASRHVAYWLGVLNAGLGRKEEALHWLERAYEDHDASMVYLRVDPLFDGIRSEPRFIGLLRKMKFQE